MNRNKEEAAKAKETRRGSNITTIKANLETTESTINIMIMAWNRSAMIKITQAIRRIALT